MRLDARSCAAACGRYQPRPVRMRGAANMSRTRGSGQCTPMVNVQRSAALQAVCPGSGHPGTAQVHQRCFGQLPIRCPPDDSHASRAGAIAALLAGVP